MPIETRVERIDLATTPDLRQAIVNRCDIRAQDDPPKHLAASFESQNQLVLIFQSA